MDDSPHPSLYLCAKALTGWLHHSGACVWIVALTFYHPVTLLHDKLRNMLLLLLPKLFDQFFTRCGSTCSKFESVHQPRHRLPLVLGVCTVFCILHIQPRCDPERATALCPRVCVCVSRVVVARRTCEQEHPIRTSQAWNKLDEVRGHDCYDIYFFSSSKSLLVRKTPPFFGIATSRQSMKSVLRGLRALSAVLTCDASSCARVSVSAWRWTPLVTHGDGRG